MDYECFRLPLINMENKKKTKWLVETPDIVVHLMHKRISCWTKETIWDFTAWKWRLFLDHNPDNCFWIELDEECFNHVRVKYKNIVFWDFFEKIVTMPVVDNLLLNPPYNNNSNEIIYKSLEKLKDWWRFAIISKDSTLKKFHDDFPDCGISVGLAMRFDTNLFRPFASVKTILIFWVKGETQWEYEILDFSNEEIKVNTRQKVVKPDILSPKETIRWNIDFWEKLNEVPQYDTRPTLEDFKKTIISYMAFESWLPEDMIRNPKKLYEWLHRLFNSIWN